MQLCNQPAVSVSAVDSESSSTSPSFGVDTLGGKFPRSYEGHHYAIVFVNHAPGLRDPTVAVFASHHAANTVLGLVEWIQDSEFDL
jgi:hypothetical protein